MARQIIDIGIQGNDGTGDSIRESFRKVNDNFQQLFAIFGSGETISLTDLDDTPDSYQAGQILVADTDGDGTALKAKFIVGGDGIIVDNSDPNQLIIIGGGGELIADDNPTLGAHLNANGFSIANIADPEDSVQAFNNTFNSGLPIATADNFVITKGYADRRYLQSTSESTGVGSQIRVRFEPPNTNEYTYTVDDWIGGYLQIPDHGFNTAVNGAGFVYTNTGSEPATGLLNGTIYYIRYVNSSRLGVYSTRQDAIDDTNRISVNVDPEVSQGLRGIETLTDQYFNDNLEGNWVSNEALPRVSVVRRQGDRMDGRLYLQDHPGSLAGAGTPNGDEDLQAATKFYVDQSSFASTTNLFVATSGDDNQTNTPPGKEGRALAYAYESVNKACQRAQELINESLTEPGPYRQPITYLSGEFLSTVTNSSTVSSNVRTLRIFTNGQGVDQSKNADNRDLREGSVIKGLFSGATATVISYAGTVGLNDEYAVRLLHKTTDPNNFQSNYIFASEKLINNRDFIAEETVAYISSKYPSLDYNEDTCLRDAKLIVDALVFDLKYGGNKKTLEAANTYWRGAIRALPSEQLDETLDGIDYIFLLAEQILQNVLIPAAPDPVSFGKRTTLTQNLGGNPGEQGSIELARRLTDIVLDILSSADGQGSGTLLEFQDGELVEYGQLVPELQITIRVETGVYYEQLPIRVPTNVSIKGDEFRRTIIRPAFGESQSPWARLYFYRDDEFDGMTRTYTSTASASSTLVDGNHVVTVDSTLGLEVGMYLKVIAGTGSLNELTQVRKILNATEFVLTLPPVATLSGATIRGLNTNGLAPTGENFAYHYLIDPSNINSRPKDNKDMDVFLLNDATILRNITCQSHGGFMCVLDPEGQIQTKSPYFQTCTSLSGSTGQQRFAGGMFIDGFSGNLAAAISSKTSAFQLTVSGLDLRLPQVPTSFYLEGRRYQVNQVEATANPGEAVIFLDASSNSGQGYDETEFTDNPGVVARNIRFETAGNRSMLANDYTQVNDLGYGCIATNNAISELVSVFTYYCWTSYYSVNGGQIRSTQGNSSYGQYGMRAAGRDLNEVPDPVMLADNTLQVARVYKRDTFASKNLAGEISVYIDNYQFIPYNISELEIDHGNTRSSLIINSPTFPSNVILANPGTGYQVGQLLKPTTGTPFVSDTHTGIRILDVDAGGEILTWEVFDAGQYASAPVTLNQQGTFDVDAHPLNTIPLALANGAQFTGTYRGERRVYEINAVEDTGVQGSGFDELGSPIGLNVLKLNLNSSTSSELYSSLADGQTVIIRGLQNFKFNGIEEVQPVRPSTALEFAEPAEDGVVYRTLSYNLAGPTGQPLAADQAVLTFDSSYDYVIIQTNPENLLDTDYVDGGLKTMGGTVGDTRLAVVMTDAADIARINSGNMIMAWSGKLFRITAYVEPVGANSGYIVLDDLDYGLGSLVNVTGLSEALPTVEQVTLRAGIDAGSPAEITVRISTCRASGHDFLDVGTGGFVTSNYPNNLYGAPAIPKNQSHEVIEEGQGRVFYASTDQDGIFRVGRFFTVDQGTGTVSFSASIALSNLDGIGFKRGTVVKEFSTDDRMTDAASDSVPTEGAVVSYISKRLGITPSGDLVDGSERIPQNSGFVAVTGTIPMTGNLNMGNPANRIINLAAPQDDNDAATKAYVDGLVADYDQLSELTDVNITALNANNILAYNSTTSKWANTLLNDSNVDNAAGIVQSKLSLTAATTRANATGITQENLGVASFNDANFETTDGWVSIKESGITYSKIQDMTAGRVLGNLTGSAVAPQEITPGDITVAGLDSLANSVDSTANVLSIRRNRLKTSPSSTFVSLLGQAVAGTATITNVPATIITGTGNGARFNVTRTDGQYTAITVSYGGSGYAEGNRLLIDGSLLGGESVVNDLSFTIETTGSNLDTDTVLGVNRVSIAAEAGSIVSTDSNKNLGNTGNRFATIYTDDVNVLDTVLARQVEVDTFVRVGVDSNVILTAANNTQSTAYAISKTITAINATVNGAGVRLPIPNTLGYRLVLVNASGIPVKVWPNVGANVNGTDPNTAYDLEVGSTIELLSVTSTKWFTLNATFAS